MTPNPPGHSNPETTLDEPVYLFTDKAIELPQEQNGTHESSLAQEFVLEGTQIGIRQAVVEALSVRFGEQKTGEFTEALARITDLARLKELHRLAIKARRLSQFRQALTST
jgi:hypothetical protein